MSEIPYLERELLGGVSYEINEDYINIGCNHTNFIRVTREDMHFSEKEMYDQLKKIKTLSGGSPYKVIGTAKIKKFIKENWAVYEAEVKNGLDIYEKMIQKANEVKARGIHYGCSDDEVLSELEILRNKYQEMYWRTSMFSKMNRIFLRLVEVVRDLEFPDCLVVSGKLYLNI